MCPLCNGFDTAVNPRTNLARCFACEKNFNTIDLVMLVRQADFVQSTKFLQSIHQKEHVSQDRAAQMTISGSNPQDRSRVKLTTQSEKSNSGPYRIGKILDSVLPQKQGGSPETRFAEPKPNKPVAVLQNIDQDRMAKLEQQLEYLGRQIEKIVRTINGGLPSK